MKVFFSPLIVASATLVAATAAVAADHESGISPDQATEVTLTERVLLSEVKPLGLNLYPGNWWDPPLLKTAFEENFEGTLYRQFQNGVLYADGFATKVSRETYEKWWGPQQANLAYLYDGAQATVVTGAAYGTTRRINQLSFRKQRGASGSAGQDGDAEEVVFLHFDEPIALDGEFVLESCILIDSDQSGEGSLGMELDPRRTRWASTNLRLSSEVSSESFGKSSLMLDASDPFAVWNPQTQQEVMSQRSEAYFTARTTFFRHQDSNGDWRVRFKARYLDEAATLKVETKYRNEHYADPLGHAVTSGRPSWLVPLGEDWEDFEWEVTIRGLSEPDDLLAFQFVAENGRVLVDDIVVYPAGESDHPTAFADAFVETLEHLQVGVLRYPNVGAGHMPSLLSPRLESVRTSTAALRAGPQFAGVAPVPFSLGEFFELCHHLGAEAWFVLPATVPSQEMELLMEYLGGAADTQGGAIRIAQGFAEPWTELLSKIHLQIGDKSYMSQWHQHVHGFVGPDYTEQLFQSVHNSPYFSDRMVCHAAGPYESVEASRQIMGDTPSADHFAVAVKRLNRLGIQSAKRFTSDAEFFRYALGFQLSEHDQSLRELASSAEEAGQALSVYAIHWAMVGEMPGSNLEASGGRIGDFVTSVPGALGTFNTILMLQRDFGVRTLCLERFYGDLKWEIHGEGRGLIQDSLVTNFSAKSQGFRPSGQLFSMVNEVLGGDLLETVHSGAEPTFLAPSRIPGGERSPPVLAHPSLHSYAFKQGNQYGLILFNLDLEEDHAVLVKSNGTIEEGSLRSRRLAPEHWQDDNEALQGPPQVQVETLEVKVGSDGIEVTLPPTSCQILIWTSKSAP